MGSRMKRAMVGPQVLLVATSFLLMFVGATVGDMEGPCPGGFPTDAGGCCPQLTPDEQALYRDGRGCYARVINGVAFWPDGTGCYPDSEGRFNTAVVCPLEQKCFASCLKPPVAVTAPEELAQCESA